MTLITKHKKCVKPEMICKYSEFMRGVDYLDQKIEQYRFPHRCSKWWHRIFHHIFEIAVFNAFVIWNKGRSETYLEFRKDLSIELLRQGKMSVADETKVVILPNEIEYIEKTFLHGIIKQKDSLQCKKKKLIKRVKYQCKQCKVALCPECFDIFHFELIADEKKYEEDIIE